QRRRRSRCETLDGVHEGICCTDAETVGTDERLDERAVRMLRWIGDSKRRRELRDVLRQVPSGFEQTSVQQVMEVQRAFLTGLKLRQQERMDRTADDATFDQRAGVDADDSAAVKQRIEVI